MMSSPQPTTLLSLPNELLLGIFRSSPDLENELIYLGRTCRRLNSLCIPLYLKRQGIIFRNLFEDAETANLHQTLSEDAAFPSIPRENALKVHPPESGHSKCTKFDLLALNLHDIPCRSSSENSSALPNLSSQGHNTENTSAGTLTLHNIDLSFHPPDNLPSLLRFFSRIEHFLRHRHIQTNIVSLYNLQPIGSLGNGADLSQWLHGVAGLLNAILESGCRTLEIVSSGDRTTSYYALWQVFSPQVQDDHSEKPVNGLLTRMRAALPKLAFHLPFSRKKGRRDHPVMTPTPTTSDPARPPEEGSHFSPLWSPSGSWSYKPSRNQRDQPILAEMSNAAQQLCRLTCLVVSTPIMIVPPVSNWLFMLLQLPTCPLTKLAFTEIESSTRKWEAFFECLEACFLLKEKAVRSANGHVGSPSLKELCIARCHGIPRGSILKLLSSLKGLETIKLEVLRFESLELDPPKPHPQLDTFTDAEDFLEYPSDPRFTRSSVLPSATMEVLNPELPHLTSLTIPSNWAHDFPFQSSSKHFRTIFIQIEGDISTPKFWELGGGTKLAHILPLYSPPKGVLLGLHIRFQTLYLSQRWRRNTMTETKMLLKDDVCPLIHCLFLDEGFATWRKEFDEMSWLCMFPNLTHVKVGSRFSGFRTCNQKQETETRLRTLFWESKTLKTVEFEGVVYDRESWKEALELLDNSSPATALMPERLTPSLS